MTYKELVSDERYGKIFERCQEFPIGKVLASNIDNAWPDLPEELREAHDNYYNPNEYYYESIIDVIDDYFLYYEEDITEESKNKVLDYAMNLKDIYLVFFDESTKE